MTEQSLKCQGEPGKSWTWPEALINLARRIIMITAKKKQGAETCQMALGEGDGLP